MFTGIVTEVGSVAGTRPAPGGRRLRIDAPATCRGLAVGGSVAVDGVCLTAVEVDRRGFSVDVVPETLRRSTLGDAGEGRRVNLERPLGASGELSGHFVQGHVDGRAAVSAVRRRAREVVLELRLPRAIAPLVVEKGSVSINGVSLTVASVGRGRFTVALIPHTLAHTNLGDLRSGALVNVEADILGKYVRAFLDKRR